MNKQAYLIGFINKETFQLHSVGIYSEFPIEIQQGQSSHQVMLCTVYDRDFSLAKRALKRHLAGSEWHWLLPLLVEMRR